MNPKRRYTRTELIQKAPEPQAQQCVLCRGFSFGAADIRHAEDCPLADADVTFIIVTSRASVVFRFYENRWWWRSPNIILRSWLDILMVDTKCLISPVCGPEP